VRARSGGRWRRPALRAVLAAAAAALALAASAAAGPGCATVKPWERSQLARRCMTFGANRLELKFAAHVRETREGATGGAGGYGGGCGCN
jgi:hypothetical protein